MKSSHSHAFTSDHTNEPQDVNTASSKLEVMSANQFNRCTLLNVVIIGIAFIHVIFLASACNTVWFKRGTNEGHQGRKIESPRVHGFAQLYGTIVDDRYDRTNLFPSFLFRLYYPYYSNQDYEN